MDEYHLAEQIGEGSFGKVFKGRRRYTSQIVALKLINKHGKSEKDMRNLRQVRPRAGRARPLLLSKRASACPRTAPPARGPRRTSAGAHDHAVCRR
jgi:serine/threonine protein kinase